MKIPTKGSSKFYAKEDLAAPRVLTMANVTFERLRNSRGEDDVYVLHFAEPDAKRLVLRPLNRKAIVAAYGDETDAWRGKRIELYVDPTVEMGGAVLGGIRVRLPVAAPVQPPLAAGNKPTLADQHAKALAAFRRADTIENLKQWATWAKQFGFQGQRRDELVNAYQDRRAFLESASRRPAAAAGR